MPGASNQVQCPACGAGIPVGSAGARVVQCAVCGVRVPVSFGEVPDLPPAVAAPVAAAPVAAVEVPRSAEVADAPLPFLPPEMIPPLASGSPLSSPSADGSSGAVLVDDDDDDDDDFVPLMLDRSNTPRAGAVAPANVSSPVPLQVPAFLPPPVAAPAFLAPPPQPAFPASVPAATSAKAGPAAAVLTTVARPLRDGPAHAGVELAGSDGHPAARRPHPFWWVALGVMGTAAALVFVLVLTKQVDWFSPWEDSARPRVVALKADAERLVAAGKLPEAHAKYAEIDAEVGGRDVRDAGLADVLNDARADGKRVYAALLARQEAAAAAAQRAAAPPVAVVPPPVVPPRVVARPATAPVARRDDGDPAAMMTPRPPPTVVPPVAVPRPPQPQPPPEPVAEVRRVRPAPRPVPLPAGELTDEQIGDAIAAGAAYLLEQFDRDSNTIRMGGRRGGGGGGDPSYVTGLNALALYAILQAGQAVDDPRFGVRDARVRAIIAAVKAMPMTGGHATYARGLRSTALALFNRREDYPTMFEDADHLLGTADGGAYTYSGTYLPAAKRGQFASRGLGWDNSNAQYGLLGVWSAAEAEPRFEVPLAYWRAVAKHWTDNQVRDGTWGYTQGDENGRLTMTCAGIASLFVAHEYLEPATTSGQVGRDPFPPALKKALDWFETGDNAVSFRENGWWGYTLYGIERVGLASGFKHFGTNDWYRVLAKQVLKRQERDGSFAGRGGGAAAVDTAYAVLFLSRGRHPVMMSKLRFDGFWSNRPRDLANLARFAGRQIERPLNWQVVSAANPWTEWTDCPVLFIASHEAPGLTDAQVDNLRRFVESGGLLFTHADGSAPKFDGWARQLAAKLFPKYPLAPVPDSHPLWSVVYRPTVRPPLMGVNNGSRLLMVHCPSDLALKWQQRIDRPYEVRAGAARATTSPVVNPDESAKNAVLAPFQLGTNVFFYAAGKRDFRNRIDSTWVAAPATAPIDTVRVARLRHAGNWDPEPGAWVRYANWFQRATGTKLQVEPVDLADLKEESSRTFPFAHLTGTAAVAFAPAEVEGLRRFVAGGGVVLVEPTGGLNGFDAAVRTELLPKAFPDDFPRLIDPAVHPAFGLGAPGTEDCTRPRVRMYTLDRMPVEAATVQELVPGTGPGKPKPKGSKRAGCVIVTSQDLTTGLLGANTWGVTGFHPRYCQSLVKNLIFWATDGMPGR